ncbi:MAG: hypothetical protein HZB26_16000 [Candidatus Hydrogenedentes bacterium]|nr:hypothetical protein [Candidatus Hydrogenedentota bacterium]
MVFVARKRVVLATCVVAATAMTAAFAQTPIPIEGGRTGVTFYVSKNGDNSDGSSWSKAFTTIQQALLAVPDDKGGHRIVIQPDRYVEANLYPAYKGARGAYNVVTGDYDGSLGSGAKGWVIVDSSCPDQHVRANPSGDEDIPGFVVTAGGPPEPGLKSIDWWSAFRSDRKFSAIGWDRWVWRHAYVTGSEGGILFDLTCEEGKEFTVVVEDCVGIGRFAGAMAAAFVSRPDEPIVFRDSYFCNMNWWSDDGAAYVRAHNTSMPAAPDVTFENCTLVSPDNALQTGNIGYAGYTRIALKNCRMLSLNFSPPHGPGTGIINSRVKGEYLHVDFEDCVMMGLMVFGTGLERGYDGKIAYTVKGKVKAYLQFREKVPEGFEAISLFPVELYAAIRVPQPGELKAALSAPPPT